VVTPADRIPILLGFLADDPTDAFSRFALAQEYAKAGRSDEALAEYERLVREQPDYVGTYYHLGKLLEQVGRSGDAEHTYRAGIAVAERLRDAHSRAELADALLHLQGLGWDDD
jgi:tetratricopeptide (TPR) repeat protein